MQSVIVAFQSEDFRRVKIGVGRPVSSAAILEYVLTPFDASSRSLVANACREAAQRAARNRSNLDHSINRLETMKRTLQKLSIIRRLAVWKPIKLFVKHQLCLFYRSVFRE